jgi:hypothetical protein
VFLPSPPPLLFDPSGRACVVSLAMYHGGSPQPPPRPCGPALEQLHVSAVTRAGRGAAPHHVTWRL